MSIEYLTSNDWEAGLPNWFTPELMMRENIILQPWRVMKILRRAKDFLISTDGPNKSFRATYVSDWFDSWWGILGHAQSLRNYEIRGDFVVHPGIVTWDKLGVCIHKENQAGERTGFASMAGGEGHPGHLFFLKKMREQVGWRGRLALALEKDSYLASKERGKPFLPLPESNCRYSFGTRGEPTDEIALIKSRRGATDIQTLLPRFETPSTTQRVRRLFDFDNHLSVEWERKIY